MKRKGNNRQIRNFREKESIQRQTQFLSIEYVFEPTTSLNSLFSR